MRWIYRLQQRLAITKKEAFFILMTAFLFCLGLVAQHLQRRPEALPEDTYAALDQAFEEASSRAAVPEEAGSSEKGPVPLALERMDLNAATASDLERLPRVGPALAARIVAYRAAHGPFREVADLVEVRGIGAKTLARLEPYLFVSEE